MISNSHYLSSMLRVWVCWDFSLWVYPDTQFPQKVICELITPLENKNIKAQFVINVDAKSYIKNRSVKKILVSLILIKYCCMAFTC